MLQTTDLEYSYDQSTMLNFPSISLKPERGLLILGNSGCGKTTLLHLIAGFIEPSNGEILIDKTKLNTLEGVAKDKFRGQNIGFIFQQSRLISALNVFDNLRIGQYFTKNKDEKKINLLLEELGLYSKKKRKPASLSLGEQQRLSIARSLVNHPKLILADEPTASLDDMNAEKVINLLFEQTQKHKVALLIATHDKRLKDHFSDKIVLA